MTGDRRALLEARARLAADGLGHKLGAWRQHAFYKSITTAWCERCGRAVAVNTRPVQGETDLGGLLLRERCGVDKSDAME